MRESIKKIFKTQQHIKKFILISTLLIGAIWLYIYNNTFFVVVRFKELGPVSKHMAAYYNGFKIGKIVKVEPDSDFKNILVRVNLKIRNLKLPQNTTVHVKNFPSGELYLQFMYPEAPTLKSLRRGEVLEGISPYQLEEFMIGQNLSGVTDIVSVHVLKALEAMEVANLEMKMFFTTTTTLMQKNQQEINLSMKNIVSVTENLAQAAKNLNQTTKKINDAIDTKVIKDTTINIKETTNDIKTSATHIKSLTENIQQATKNIDKTIKKADDTVAQANMLTRRLNHITVGLQKTLSKRFAGMRLMFGKPIDSKQ